MIEFVLFILFKSGSEFNVVLNDIYEGEINGNKCILFQKNGFNRNKLYYMQGDMGLLQYKKP